MYRRILQILVISALWSGLFAQGWQSSLVYYNDDSTLVYVRDSLGNQIPDFSYAGYKNGNDSIPQVPVIKTVSAISGDNTTNINNALFEAALTPLNADGIRGAVYLEPGLYEVSGTIKLQYDGIILRGAGDGDDPATSTIIKATGDSPHQRTVLLAGGGASTKWTDNFSGSQTDIITDTVLVGEKTFEVADASFYTVGDNVIIYHPCTEEWLQAIDYGGTHSGESGSEPDDIPWETGTQPLVFNRHITAIDGNKITVDVPFYNHLIRDLAQSYMYKYKRQGIRTNIGIENLRIDIEYNGSEVDENHAWNAIDMYLIEDAWVRDCTFLHFGLSGVRTNTATRITVENVNALDPIARVIGGQRYNFQFYTASQQILFINCHATNGRHHWVSNGMSWTSGIVITGCTSSGAYTSSEGHRRWTMGMLFDDYKELDGPRPGYNPRLIGLYNRGYYGTSHGWGSIHSVAWNADVNDGELIVQKPPTAQNYAIGCFGPNVSGDGASTFDEPEGFVEGTNIPGLEPRSLYQAQLKDRLSQVVSVKPVSEIMPDNFTVYQNYPNPFNPTTLIKFELPGNSKVVVRVFNVLGELVKVLDNTFRLQGTHYLEWNGTNSYGDKVNSGIYIYSVETEFGTISNKMVLLK